MSIPAVTEGRNRVVVRICRECGVEIDGRLCAYSCTFDVMLLENRKGHVVVRVYDRVDTLIEEREE